MKNYFECLLTNDRPSQIKVELSKELIQSEEFNNCFEPYSNSNDFLTGYYFKKNFPIQIFLDETILDLESYEIFKSNSEKIQNFFECGFFVSIELVETDKELTYKLLIKLETDYIPYENKSEEQILEKLEWIKRELKNTEEYGIVESFLLKKLFTNEHYPEIEDIYDELLLTEEVEKWKEFSENYLLSIVQKKFLQRDDTELKKLLIEINNHKQEFF